MSTIPLQRKPLRRSRSHRILGGVCGGLADYVGTDPLLMRVIFVLFGILAGSGLLLYLLLWVLIPAEGVESAPGGARTT